MNDLVQIGPREAAEAGASSLTTFGKLFFPRAFRQESPAFHEAIGGALYSPSRYNAFEVFRDGAKTTLLRTYKAQRISYGISRTIMYVSVSQQHSMFSLRWLRRQVMYNKRWTQTFGLAQGQKWTDEHCEIIHENMPRNEDGSPALITALAMGITGQIRGFNPDDYRPDLIIIDDILNEENTATPEQRQKIEALLFGALLNSLAPATEAPLAKAVFLQTPFVKNDAIEKCMVDPEWNPVRFGIFDEKGQSRWPSRYPTEALLKAKEAHIRRSQYRLWMREKECKIVSGEEKAIDVSRFKHYDVLPEYLDVLIAIDPASSDNEAADDHAIAAVGFKGNDVYILAYALSKAVMPDKAANDFFNLVLLTKPRKLVVEGNGYQRTLKWYIEQEMTKRRIWVACEMVQTKTRKANRIMSTIPMLAAYGHFHIKPNMTELIEQADDYDPNVKEQADDLLDAISMAIIDQNPALRGSNLEDPETGALIENEEEYEDLIPGGAP